MFRLLFGFFFLSDLRVITGMTVCAERTFSWDPRQKIHFEFAVL
jgi:hypothetical protein